jgi:hypothetical protein
MPLLYVGAKTPAPGAKTPPAKREPRRGENAPPIYISGGYPQNGERRGPPPPTAWSIELSPEVAEEVLARHGWGNA